MASRVTVNRHTSTLVLASGRYQEPKRIKVVWLDGLP